MSLKHGPHVACQVVKRGPQRRQVNRFDAGLGGRPQQRPSTRLGQCLGRVPPHGDPQHALDGAPDAIGPYQQGGVGRCQRAGPRQVLQRDPGGRIAPVGMGRGMRELQDLLRALNADCHVLVFGHLGDGNLHLVAHVPEAFAGGKEEVERTTYALLQRYGGSVSAEHGIGITKRSALPCSRTPAEIETMRTLKRALDPRGILSPGRIVEVGASGGATGAGA